MGKHLILPRVLFATVALALTQTATAQDRIGQRKHSLRIEYQFASYGAIDSPDGPIDLGETTSHVLLLSGTFSLNERWKIFGSIPYVRKRHKGAAAHDPFNDFFTFEPPDMRIVDDGRWHGGFQDLYIGAQYLAVDGPLSISTYFSLGGPVSDYPIYGNAIIGKHLWEMPVGVNFHFTPHFSDWSFAADISYVFSEEVLGIDLDYWLLHASASYYVTPRFAPRVFLVKRHAPNALGLYDEFLGDWDNEAGFHHDRILKHAYLNGGIGFDYIVNDRYSISANYYETIEQDVIADADSAYTFALTHRF